jgi:hypothetical protein
VQINVTIQADADDELPEPDEVARLVLEALGGNDASDHCSVYVSAPPAQGSAGSPPAPPEPPPVPTTATRKENG